MTFCSGSKRRQKKRSALYISPGEFSVLFWQDSLTRCRKYKVFDTRAVKKNLSILLIRLVAVFLCTWRLLTFSLYQKAGILKYNINSKLERSLCKKMSYRKLKMVVFTIFNTSKLTFSGKIQEKNHRNRLT